MKRILWFLPIILLANGSYLGAFEVSTHQILNERAVRNTSLDDYLRSNLDFTNGIGQIFGKERKSVLQWIIDGGAFEDQGNFLQIGGRYYNHFHNPLKPWSQAGLSITYQGVTFLNESSLIWAQRAAGTQQFYGNYSWHDAMDYFYKALTYEDPTIRDQAFADTFRAVGQVMHLIEDASVPAHTRNDAHVLYNYEKWVKANENFLNTTPIFSTAPLSVSLDGKVPITQFWDTNKYDGSLPLTGTDIGIAEYSNANFLSNDTIFLDNTSDPHYFPYPNKSLTETWVDETNNRQYLRNFGRGELLQHMAVVSFLNFYRLRYFPQYSASLPLGLDDLSYKEQADKLVPRAVGYSAGLINYFFRGQIDAHLTQDGITIINQSDEDMNGTFELYYDDILDQRHPVEGTRWTLSIPAGGKSPSRSFSTEPIPFQQEPGKFMLVFRGKLGAEADAVVGKMVKLKNYAFIIQETLSLNSAETSELSLDEKYDFGFTDRRVEGSKKFWQTLNNTLTGRFVTYGTIQSIVAEGADRFYINNVYLPNDSWIPSMTPTPPLTWRIEGGGPQYIEIRMTDNTVIRQKLFHYNEVSSTRYKSISRFQCTTTEFRDCQVSENESVTATHHVDVRAFNSVLTDPSDIFSFSLSIVPESLSVSLRDQFRFLRSGSGVANVIMDKHIAAVFYREPLPGGVRYQEYTTGKIEREDRLVTIYILGPETSSPYDIYYSLTVPDYLPLSISGQIDRIYEEAELDYLNQLGIEPENYSITLN